MLRILWLNWRDIRNPDAGGAEVFTHEVAKRLARRGWSVTLFTSMFPGAEPEEELEGVELLRRGGRFAVYSKAKDYCRRYANDFDVVVDEINTRPFMTPRYVRTRPILALIHQLAREYWFYEMPMPIAFLGYYYLEKAWLTHYRSVRTITVSESTKADLSDWGFTDVHIVPEGLSVPIADKVPRKGETPIMLFVGRLKRIKKPDHAIRAFEVVHEKIPDARLFIAGDGYLRARLEHMAGGGVQFLGRIEESAKVELMTRAHVLLFPAVREGWGLTITEANARGTPVVAYNVPGVRDAIVDGQTGVLVKRDDWEAMGRESLNLLQNAGRREIFAANALKMARRFSWDRTSSEFAAHLLHLGIDRGSTYWPNG